MFVQVCAQKSVTNCMPMCVCVCVCAIEQFATHCWVTFRLIACLFEKNLNCVLRKCKNFNLYILRKSLNLIMREKFEIFQKARVQIEWPMEIKVTRTTGILW